MTTGICIIRYAAACLLCGTKLVASAQAGLGQGIGFVLSMFVSQLCPMNKGDWEAHGSYSSTGCVVCVPSRGSVQACAGLNHSTHSRVLHGYVPQAAGAWDSCPSAGAISGALASLPCWRQHASHKVSPNTLKIFSSTFRCRWHTAQTGKQPRYRRPSEPRGVGKPIENISSVAWDKQSHQFLSERTNQCVHPEVATGTLTRPLWQPPPPLISLFGNQPTPVVDGH